jgi:glycosyltransferase involved in cell wall biosynthesis
MKNDESISVIIPALNEEEHLGSTIETVVKSLKGIFEEYEIFIFNDGSTDNTGYIAEQISKKNSFVKVIHNKKTTCLGSIYNYGRKLAKMNYLILVNGKNDISSNELKKIFLLKGQADIVIPYAVNIKERPLLRRFFSRLFVLLVNFLFKFNLKYYNHYVLHKRTIINSIDINTVSYAFQAEALIKLMKRGHSYIEVGVKDDFRNYVETKAFNPKNVLGVLGFLFSIIAEFYFKRGNSNNNL